MLLLFTGAHMDGKETFGIRLREVRLSKGLGLSTLADLAKISPAALSRIEREVEIPSPEFLESLESAGISGIEFKDLFNLAATAEKKQPLSLEEAEKNLPVLFRKNTSKDVSGYDLELLRDKIQRA